MRPSRLARSGFVNMKLVHNVGQLSHLTKASAIVRQFTTRSERLRQMQAKSVPCKQQFDELFTSIENGLHGMKEANAGFHWTRENNGLRLVIHTGIDGKKFIIEGADNGPNGCKVMLDTPKASHSGGAHTYTKNFTSGFWESETDKHFLQELLARDLIYFCKGYPSF